MTQLLTGKYLQEKQILKTTFAGRRLTIVFDEMDEKIETKIERLDLNLPNTMFFAVSSKSIFYTKEIAISSETKEIISSEYFNPDLLETIENRIMTPIIYHEKFPVRATRGFLIHGQSGVGKTELLRYFLAQIKQNDKFEVVWVNSTSDLELYAKKRFKHAVVVIDNFENYSTKDINKTFVSDLLLTIDKANDGHFFIISTNRIDLVDERLRNNGRFEIEVDVLVPSVADRTRILQYLCDRMGFGKDINAEQVAARLHGFVASDICALVKRAFVQTLKSKMDVTEEGLVECIKFVTPSAMKTVAVSVQKVRWADIGGSDRIRKSLQQLIEWPLKYPDKMKSLGIRSPRGVLLYGPPGCSKTMIAKALATESELKFLTIKGAELLSKYVGESERALRNVFHKARQSAPSILFFDEIDAVAVTRGEQNSVVTDRMITTLLTELDGITDDADNNPVILIAATNRPHMIDPALLRPGRIDRFEYEMDFILSYSFTHVP